MAATLLLPATPASFLAVDHNVPITSFRPPGRGKTMRDLKLLHSQIIKAGLNHDHSSVTNFISTCTEMGTFESLEYAQKALEIFVGDNGTMGTQYLFNSLIRGYSACGFGDKAILVFHKMMSAGVLPDNYTFPFVLSACTKREACMEGMQVHGATVKMGYEGDMFVENSLVHLYGEGGNVEDMRKVFDKMSRRNVVSWTSLIGGYVGQDRSKEAISLFFEMVEEGITPNSVTMVSIFSACAKLKDLELAKKICAYIDESELKANRQMVNALVDMYMKCGDTDAAMKLFDECVDKDLVLCNTVMSNFVHDGLASEALAVLNVMIQSGLQPDRITILSTIAACSLLDNSLLGKSCHAYVFRNGMERWDNICNAMIDMYMKNAKQEMACRIFDHMSNKNLVSWNSLIAGVVRNGDMESAWDIFKKMPERNLVSWNTVIGALVQQSMFEDAIELFRSMQSEGMKADTVTMMSVASACGHLGSLELAKWVYCYIERNEIHCDLQLGTALVDMFARCGDPRSAMQVFLKMDKRDVSAWTAAIGALAVEGNGNRAILLFNEMLQQGIKPDAVVFVGLLAALSHGGLVEQGRHFFYSMKDVHGIDPQVVHYGCMVDMLGRAGLVREAFDLINHMPMEPNAVIWRSLLAACRMHGNVNIAAHVAERIAESDPDSTGAHVLLSNVYAYAGKWTEVSKVRLRLKEKGIRKVPGSSSIDIHGIVHEFTSGDDSHPEMACIRPIMDEIDCRIRDAGYVPDLANVLLNVEEREKEFLLSRHSERLAIAFGLISSRQRMPIRVTKNLRMCSDCHSFTKLVSKVYNREIIVRDNNRFHFFLEGLCSCNDYW